MFGPWKKRCWWWNDKRFILHFDGYEMKRTNHCLVRSIDHMVSDRWCCCSNMNNVYCRSLTSTTLFHHLLLTNKRLNRWSTEDKWWKEQWSRIVRLIKHCSFPVPIFYGIIQSYAIIGTEVSYRFICYETNQRNHSFHL